VEVSRQNRQSSCQNRHLVLIFIACTFQICRFPHIVKVGNPTFRRSFGDCPGHFPVMVCLSGCWLQSPGSSEHWIQRRSPTAVSKQRRVWVQSQVPLQGRVWPYATLLRVARAAHGCPFSRQRLPRTRRRPRCHGINCTARMAVIEDHPAARDATSVGSAPRGPQAGSIRFSQLPLHASSSRRPRGHW